MQIRKKMELVSWKLSGAGLTGAPSSLRRQAARWLLPVAVALSLVQAPGARAQGGGSVVLTNSFKPIQRASAAAASGANTPAATGATGTLVRSELTAAETNAPMKIAVSLKLRNFQELQRRVAAQEIISPAEMAARYLPLEQDYQAVAQWLASQGLTVEPGGAGRVKAFAQGTPAQLAQAFQAPFGRVEFESKEYTSVLSAPSLPASLMSRVGAVTGLQPYLGARKNSTVVPNVNDRPPYLINEILGAYEATGTGLTGAGQAIAIIIDAFPNNSDLTSFWQINAVPQKLSNIVKVDLSSTTGIPNPEGEETLDVEWSSGIASGAQIVIYGTGSLSFGGLDAAYSQVVNDLQSGARPGLHQLSMSYGVGEMSGLPDDVTANNELFTAMTAYGVTLFASSGDAGAFNGPDNITPQVSYPASDPNIVAVGGTSLFLDRTIGVTTNETAWSPDGFLDAGGRNGSSGGGISQRFPRPPYQVSSSITTGNTRLVPDISLTADPTTGCLVILDGLAEQFGGTSWSSPSWAGLCAMINQARARAGLRPVGALNTSLYALQNTDGFRDIVVGNNGYYQAGLAYDMVTGLGVPRFTNLVAQLLTNLPAPVITSPSAVTTQQYAANPSFSYQIIATNVPTSFGASGLPEGLSLDIVTGLITGVPLTSGYFPVLITASNPGGTGAITLALTVLQSGSLAPTITGFTPLIGSIGTTVTITGTNFTTVQGNITGVSFNGVSATFNNTATEITAVVPPGATTGPIVVSSPGGTASSSTNFIVTTPTQAPTITSPLALTAFVGVPFLYQITATDGPTGYNALGLPAGLTVNPATGLISGTTTTLGSYQVTLSATNRLGTGSAVLLLTVLPPPPVIISPLNATASVGSPFRYQIEATNAPLSYNATGPLDGNGQPTVLPPGLGVDPSTGLLSGTPTQAGAYRILLSATNAGGTGTATLTLSITPAIPVITSLPQATAMLGTPFTYQITANNNPTSFGATGLPPGLTLNTATGLISGVPTQLGTFGVTLQATNPSGTSTFVLTITVLPATPVITSALSTQGQVGSLFTYQITASGSPTSFNASGLPGNVAVDTRTGLISGTPLQPGTYQITLLASNAGSTGRATLTLSVAVATPAITSSLTVIGSQNIPFTYQITATNSPVSFGAVGLPEPLTINTATGLISGTPQIPGTYQVTLSATNSGATGTAVLTLLIVQPTPVITSGLAAVAQRGIAFRYQVTSTNSPTLFTATGLPPGLGINQATGAIVGIPVATGTYSVALTAGNPTGTGTATLVLVVQAAPGAVNLTASLPRVESVSGNVGQIVITRSGDTSQPLKVFFTVAGSARAGVDIAALPVSKTIKAGKATARLNINVLGSDLGGLTKRVVKVTVTAPSDGSYTVGGTPGAKVKIVPDQP